MKLIIALLLLAIPCSAANYSAVISQYNAASTTECSTSTDYLGYNSYDSNDSALSEDTRYVQLFTPTCTSGCSSGTFKTAVVRHSDTSSANLKICLYSDNGTAGTPDILDLKLECATVNSSIVEWADANSDFSTAVTCGTNYWILIVTDATAWRHDKDTTTGTVYYENVSGGYTTMPDNLAADSSWSSVTRTFSAYVEIGP